MEKQRFYNGFGKAFFVALCFLTSLSGRANTEFASFSVRLNGDTSKWVAQEFVKTYNKTFTVSPKQLVVLANKYGKVDVKTGSEKQVVVNIKVTVDASTQVKADKTFDLINIAFSEGPDFVKAETFIESNNNWGINVWSGHSDRYQIDYEVIMPAENMLDVSNRYGNTKIMALKNWLKVDQKYGDFRLDGANSMTLNLAYGNGFIDQLGGLTGEISYGKLNSNSLKDVDLKTKYSELRLTKADNCAIQSAYDDYEIQRVTNLTINGKYGELVIGDVDNVAVDCNYTDVRIKKMNTSADFNTSYGDVKVDEIRAGFNQINVKGNYTDFTLGVDPSVEYHLDAKTSYGDVNRPNSLKCSVDREEGSKTELVGYKGSSSAKSTIKVRLNYGDLLIR
ncbi:MAG: DUF4097 domain-containing protein [Saprospiraceae bacterium]|nr:DUF4097 domain-containing protein [Saprospiraceae bacterium]